MLRHPKQLKYIAPGLPKGKSGQYEIDHEFHPAHTPITAISMRTFIFTGKKPLTITYDKPIPYTILKDKNRIWMTNTPAEQTSQHHALKKCKGRVLVGGLGLGYFVKKLQEKDNITKVTVVEISQDVINLVWKQLRLDSRFSIIHMDIKKYLKIRICTREFDWVYLDTWRGDDESEFVNTVLPLKRLVHKTVCKKVNHILSWQEDVMLGQIQSGIQTNLMLKFAEIKTMPEKKFNEIFKGRYQTTRKILYNHIRKHNLDIDIALKLLPAYITWIRNGMNGEF